MSNRVLRHCLIAVAALAVVLPAGALAASKGYVGSIVGDNATEVSFVKKKNRNGKRFVKEFIAEGVRADCTKGKRRIDLSADGKARIKRGRFVLEIDNGIQTLKFRGKLRKGGVADGVLRFSGLAEFANGSRQDCKTGRLEWEATS